MAEYHEKGVVVPKQVSKPNKSVGKMETISSCLACVCLTSDLADVYFSFPDENERRIPAHKMILALRSSVFKAMFYGSFPQEVGDIRIQDVEANIFQLLMRYLYTDNIDLDGETVVPLLYTAQKYQVTSLMSICAKYLKDMITVHNACTIYSQAKFFDLASLRNHALTFIAKNASGVFESEDFLSLATEHVAEIIQLDSLCLPEINVFLSIIRWADQKIKSKSFPIGTKRRDILLQGGILYLIAIPLLSLEEYTKHVVPSGILTDEEQLHLFKAITMKQSHEKSLFRTCPRKGGTRVTISIEEIVSSNSGNTSRFGYNTCEPYYYEDNMHNMTTAWQQINEQTQSETIYLKSSKAFRIVAVNVNPKYQMSGKRNQKFASNIICTVLGKTVKGVLRNQPIKLEIDVDVKPNSDLDISVKMCPNPGFQNTQQFPIQKMPRHNYQRKKDNFMFQHKLDHFMIQFSFDGLYLVESIEIMHL